jgi:hypothetical protein
LLFGDPDGLVFGDDAKLFGIFVDDAKGVGLDELVDLVELPGYRRSLKPSGECAEQSRNFIIEAGPKARESERATKLPA